MLQKNVSMPIFSYGVNLQNRWHKLHHIKEKTQSK